MTDSKDILLQKKLLQSLGFEFLEVPYPEIEKNSESRRPSISSRAGEVTRPQKGTQTPSVAPPPAKELPSIQSLPAVNEDNRREQLATLANEIRGCTSCSLHLTRNQALPGQGSESPKVLCLLEAPTQENDQKADLFAGEIGKMFHDIMKAMKLDEADFSVTTALKCCPAAGRPPRRKEVMTCQPFLERQVELLRPQVIVSFGLIGLDSLLPDVAQKGMNRVRGKWSDYRGIPLLTTFPLPYIHRNTPRKKIVWGDMQIVMSKLSEISG